MPLTDVQIRKTKSAARPIKLTDGGGLYLFVAPTGSKIWRLRYEFSGREKLLTIGPYPDISLEAAREARQAQKRLLREGKDPAAEKALGKSAAAETITFERIAREWHAARKDEWTQDHADRVLKSLEADAFPKLGRLDIRGVTAANVLDALRDVEARQAIDTAHRIRQRISGVFVYAIASGIVENDPASIVAGAMKTPKRGRQPAITDLEQAREMLRRVDAVPANPATKLAMRLLALTTVRPGTFVGTTWTEIDDIDAAKPIWRIPAARMKLKLVYKEDSDRDHLVPLSRQAVETISALRTVTGRSPYILPNGRGFRRPASENALGYLLNRAGYFQRHVPHGWRTTFSTVLNEKFPSEYRIIDLMLAHKLKDKVEGAYNRAEHIERRIELAQIWADLLMVNQRPAADLISGPRRP